MDDDAPDSTPPDPAIQAERYAASCAARYALLAGLWLPAALIAVILAVTGWHRTRTSANAYALLLETSARLYARDLARQVSSDGDAGSFDAQAGEGLTAALRTEPPLAPADENQATAR